MSLDNYIAIIKKGKGYIGYGRSFSDECEVEEKPKVFTATSLKKAILKAQACKTEYGYIFLNLEK